MSGASLPTQKLLTMVKRRVVLIPDEWGKSSDEHKGYKEAVEDVLIPDEWGKSSDLMIF